MVWVSFDNQGAVRCLQEQTDQPFNSCRHHFSFSHLRELRKTASCAVASIGNFLSPSHGHVVMASSFTLSS